MKHNYYLFFGIFFVVSITIAMFFDIGEYVPEYTYDYTLPLTSIWILGGLFLLGFLAGRFKRKNNEDEQD